MRRGSCIAGIGTMIPRRGFTQPDPIGIAGGLNSYGYAGGDPVNFSDPFGLSDCRRSGTAMVMVACAVISVFSSPDNQNPLVKVAREVESDALGRQGEETRHVRQAGSDGRISPKNRGGPSPNGEGPRRQPSVVRTASPFIKYLGGTLAAIALSPETPGAGMCGPAGTTPCGAWLRDQEKTKQKSTSDGSEAKP